MIPYVPKWEAHDTSAHNLVGKFTKAYCNVPRGKVQGQKYCIAVQSFLALAQQLMGNNKDNIYLGISKNNNHWSQYAMGMVIIAKLRKDLELSGIIRHLGGTDYKQDIIISETLEAFCASNGYTYKVLAISLLTKQVAVKLIGI